MAGNEEIIKLTDAQKRAISVDPSTDRIVIAMAGSGKTTVLAEYYFALMNMNNGYDPSEIVAITFTEKAAREMRMKLIRKFMREGRDNQARELYSAPISTIHSFCSNIVKENALVLDLDPDWQVLDETQSSILMEQCLRDSMGKLKVERSDIYEVLMRRIKWGSDPYATFNDFFMDFRSRGFSVEDLTPGPSIEAVFDESMINFQDSITDFINAFNEKNANKKLSEAELRKKILLEELLSRIKQIEFENCSLELASEIDIFWRDRKLWTKVADSLIDYLDDLKKAKNDFIQKLVYIMGSDIRIAFLELVKVFDDEYQKAKTSDAVLDYDDLQDKAIKLLKDYPHVRDRIRNRIKALLVDEFQDTNPVQMALIELMRPAKRFFAVGDPRQSIYGFRHTDVSIMLKEIEKYSSDNGDVVELNENFRSRSMILDVVSEFFKDELIDPEYERMNFGCITSGRKFMHEELHNPVEFMASFGEDTDEARDVETGAIARRLAEILNEGMVIEEKSGAQRTVNPSDIVVLFRKHSNMLDYSRALEQVRIPHHVVSSQGFYYQREIMDLINFLELLSEPDDALSLCEVIRAPFCGITIDGLYRIIASMKTVEHHGKLRLSGQFWKDDSISLEKEDSERWDHFRFVFPELIERCSSMGPSGRLREILNITHFRGASAVGRGGKRRLGNIGKLLDFADTWDKDFPGDNKGFISRMKDLRFREAREGETPVSAVENSVTMMTIHSAKGLEFPIVLFADAITRGKIDSHQILLTKSGHVLVKQRVVNEEFSDKLKDFYFEEEKDERNRLENNEAKRVLYVALTRAMEKLIISFSIGKSLQGSFYEFFEKRLGVSKIQKDGIREYTIGEWKVPVIWGNEIIERPCIYFSKEEEAHAFDIANEIARIEKGLPEISNLETMYSVTAFSAWIICPRRMCLHYLYGLASLEKDIKPLRDQLKITEEDVEEEKTGGGYDEFPVMDRGTIIHRALCEIVEQKGRFSIDSFLTSQKNSSAIILKEDICKVVDSFKNSQIGQSIISADNRYLEKSFIFGVRDNKPLFKSVIDALWLKNGKWRIVDYKSGKAHDSNDAVGRAYEEQVRMYVRAVKSVFNTDVEKASLLYVDSAQEREIDISSNAMDKNLMLIDKFFESIDRGDFIPIKNDECRYCSFSDGCAAFNKTNKWGQSRTSKTNEHIT